MSEKTREHISSLMDGEISREASRFLVRRLGTDQELSATWARYHVVRDCLRNQHEGFAREDFCARVRREIDKDGTAPPSRRFTVGWLKPVAGAAIAASVALAAVMAVNPGSVPGLQAPAEVADSPALQPFSSPQGNPAGIVSSRVVSNQKMNPYLLRHYQAAGNSSGQPFIGFVPVMVNVQQPGENPATDPDTEAVTGETAESTESQ